MTTIQTGRTRVQHRRLSEPVTIQAYYAANPEQRPAGGWAGDEPELRMWATDVARHDGDAVRRYTQRGAGGSRSAGNRRYDPCSPSFAPGDAPAHHRRLRELWPLVEALGWDDREGVANEEPLVRDSDGHRKKAASWLWPDPPRPDRVRPRAKARVCVWCEAAKVREIPADAHPWLVLPYCQRCWDLRQAVRRWLVRRIAILRHPERVVPSWREIEGLTYYAGAPLNRDTGSSQLIIESGRQGNALVKYLEGSPLGTGQLEAARMDLRCAVCLRTKEIAAELCRTCVRAWERSGRPRGEAYEAFVTGRRHPVSPSKKRPEQGHIGAHVYNIGNAQEAAMSVQPTIDIHLGAGLDLVVSRPDLVAEMTRSAIAEVTTAIAGLGDDQVAQVIPLRR